MSEDHGELEISYSAGLEGWLAREQVSLAFAIPPSKLFFIGLRDDGRLSAFERTFNKCMGLAAAGPDTIYLGTRYQIWRLENGPTDGTAYGEFDRCFVPRRVWTTGYVNCHDVAVDGGGEPLFVNTRFGCLATLSDRFSFVPQWWPPFQRRRTQGDCCHLNGVAMANGTPAYVTSVSSTGELDSWRRHRHGGGVVTDVATNEIVCRGLSMPHSPRLHRGDLWLTNSGTGELGRVDLDAGRFDPVAFAPGFLRGLTFVGDYAVVGSSKFRDGGLYSGLPLDDTLARAGTGPKLGVFVIDLGTGAIGEWLLVEGPMYELFDVIALPRVRRPMALGLVTDEIETSVWFDSHALRVAIVSGFELLRLAFHEIEASPGFAGWLDSEGLSIGFTSGSRLFLAGVGDDGSLTVTDRHYLSCTALAAAGADTLFLATRFQIWRLENALPGGKITDGGHDRLFVPQTAWTTGMAGVHDLTVDGAGAPVFVNGRFSCLCVPSERLNFEPLWLPPFVSALAAEDRCHLSGVAMDEGRPAFVTCAALTDSPAGWQEFRRDGGAVLSVPTGDVVCAGLSMPHSPRLRGDRLWLANGGTGEFGFVDLKVGRFQPVAILPGFTRGLALHGRFGVLGVSRPPRGDTFEGLDLQQRLERSATDPVCGIFVVDLEAGRVEHSLVLHGGGPEVHDVAALPAVRSATAVAVQGDDVQDLVTIPCLDP